MRLLHTSDWHLGRTLHGEPMLDHQAAVLDHLVEVVRAEAVDAVLVAGDVFDRAVPPVQAVDLLSEALVRLTESARVILTPGNHDSASRLGFTGPLLRERLVVRSRIADLASPVLLGGDDGDLLVYALPYLDPDLSRHQLADASPEDASGTDSEPEVPRDGREPEDGGRVPARSHEAVLSAAMRRVDRDLAQRRLRQPGVPSVLMAHAFVVGGHASESERDIRVGGVDSVPLGVFTGANPDYVALGHLHGPQRVGAADQPGHDPAEADLAERAPLARYSGSPLPYSFSERHQRKSSVLLDVGATGVRSAELIDVPQPRRLAELEGTLAELLSSRFEAHRDDWVKVTVTDPVRPEHLHARVIERFGHALVVLHRPAGELTGGTSTRVHAGADPLRVAHDFVATVAGGPPTAAETAVLRQAYEAALTADRSS